MRDEDVESLDAYAKAHGMPSRSAALTHDVRTLRQQYEQAVVEWDESGDAELWERTTADGSRCGAARRAGGAR
jgi:hypothetical protein